MPFIYLSVTVLGAVAVIVTYRPFRHEPLSVLSFTVGWITGEAAIQNIVWQVGATVVFGVFGAFKGWAGWLGLGIAIGSWAGLVGLAVSGRRAARVVDAALTEVRSEDLPVSTERVAPTWGRFWRVTQAIPLKGRSVQMTKNIDYWGDGLRRHRLDVYSSRQTPPSGAPVMVYIHGGAWVMGEKREQGKPMMYELVARGWVCVAINYRLSPKATWPAHIVDAKKAMAWVKGHIGEYGGDPGFVAVSGGSAGGHLCALLALTAGDPDFQPGFEDADTSVDACIPFYGVMDMTGTDEGAARYGSGLVELLEKRVMKTTVSAHPDVFRAASPTYRVHAGAPPFFVLHGRNDTLVPVSVARTFVAALRTVSRAPVAYAELPLAQHAFDVLASLRCQATTAGVAAFLDAARARALRQSGPRPAPKVSDIVSETANWVVPEGVGYRYDVAADERQIPKGGSSGLHNFFPTDMARSRQPGSSRHGRGVGGMVRFRSRKMARCGLALAFGSSALSLGIGATAGAATTAATPGITAKTVTVGSISDISEPIAGLFEGAKIGTEAYFAYINSKGGVNGRKLILNGMDSAFSSGTVANEAQNIAQNDFAIVGGFSLLDGGEKTAIDAAKLPTITQVLSPTLYGDPNLYSAIPLVNGGEAVGPFKWLKKKYPQAVTHLGLIGSNSAATAITAEQTFRKLTESLGYKWLYAHDESAFTTTFLPDIIKMKNAGVQLVFEPTQQGAYISTIAQEIKEEGLNALLVSGGNAYEENFDPGSAGNGTIVTGVTALYEGQDAKVVPAVATFDKWAKQVDPQTQLDLYTLYGWINAQLFVQALTAAGANPTRASLDAQLDKITSFNASGLISPQDPAKKIPGGCWIAAEYENGTWKRIPPDPKVGFVCNPGGFYPASYQGISR